MPERSDTSPFVIVLIKSRGTIAICRTNQPMRLVLKLINSPEGINDTNKMATFVVLVLDLITHWEQRRNQFLDSYSLLQERIGVAPDASVGDLTKELAFYVLPVLGNVLEAALAVLVILGWLIIFVDLSLISWARINAKLDPRAFSETRIREGLGEFFLERRDLNN